jgi:hypothetical protein
MCIKKRDNSKVLVLKTPDWRLFFLFLLGVLSGRIGQYLFSPSKASFICESLDDIDSEFSSGFAERTVAATWFVDIYIIGIVGGSGRPYCNAVGSSSGVSWIDET